MARLLTALLVFMSLSSPLLAQPEFLGTIGFPGSGQGQLLRPTGVAVFGDEIIVLEGHRDAVMVYNRSGQLQREWAMVGGNPDNNPVDVVVDTEGILYITDSDRHLVQRYLLNGTFIDEFGSMGNGPGQFFSPTGLAWLGNDNLLVVDSSNKRLQEIDWSQSPPKFIREFGAGHEWDFPTGVAVDTEQNIFVVDPFLGVIYKLDADGEPLVTFGEMGSMPGQLLGPIALRVGVFDDQHGEVLFVADSFNGRMQMFDREGNFLSLWPPRGLPSPTRLCIAPDRRLYISATSESLIFVYQLDPVSVRRTTWSEIKTLFHRQVAPRQRGRP